VNIAEGQCVDRLIVIAHDPLLFPIREKVSLRTAALAVESLAQDLLRAIGGERRRPRLLLLRVALLGAALVSLVA
jgi:hypothetical protein